MDQMIMIMITLIAGASLGLASWLHCIGMCGPVASVMLSATRGETRRVRHLSAYHVGRTVTYVILGLLLGAVGDAVRVVLVGSVVSIITGSMIVAAAITQIIRGHFQVPPAIAMRLRRVTFLVQRSASGTYSSWHSAVLGVMNGFLPCGVSLSAIIAAATLPSMFDRIVFLVAFGVATTPALAGLAIIVERVGGRWHKQLHKVSALVLIAIGMMSVLRGLSLDIPFISPDFGYDQHGHAHYSCCNK
jgi:sulfite exporter TauE/SafE